MSIVWSLPTYFFEDYCRFQYVPLVCEDIVITPERGFSVHIHIFLLQLLFLWNNFQLSLLQFVLFHFVNLAHDLLLSIILQFLLSTLALIPLWYHYDGQAL